MLGEGEDLAVRPIERRGKENRQVVAQQGLSQWLSESVGDLPTRSRDPKDEGSCFSLCLPGRFWVFDEPAVFE